MSESAIRRSRKQPFANDVRSERLHLRRVDIRLLNECATNPQNAARKYRQRSRSEDVAVDLRGADRLAVPGRDAAVCRRALQRIRGAADGAENRQHVDV